MGIDYSKLALAKTGETPKKRRARRRRANLAAAGVDRDTRVMNRHGGNCVALGISPVCTKRAVDPHELIPVGRGGPRESWNRVPICRACHRAAQGAVGGIKLWFDWPGKADGGKPNADQPGNLKVTWKGKR